MKKLTSKILCLMLALVLALSPMAGSAVTVFAEDEVSAETIVETPAEAESTETEIETVTENEITETIAESVENDPAAESDNEEADTRISFAGENFGFFKEDGTSSFGMLSPQDGSRIVVDGNEVKIYIVPSNKTVYDGIHWGFITDETLTKDVLRLQSGCWSITTGTENCGYGLPAAPVKTEERGGGTTSSQYYLCIPALDKLPVIADYSGVDAAIAAVPADLTAYTEESVKAVTEAVAATEAEDFRFYSAAEQEEVTKAANAINEAVAALKKASVPIEEGTYALPDLKSGPGEMFNHFEADSRYLDVKGDTATIHFITDGSTKSIAKYSKIALGKASELVSEAYQQELPENITIIEGVEQAEQGENGSKYEYSITLPKAEVEELLVNDNEDDIYIVIWNKEGSSTDKIPGWYKSSKDFYLSLGSLGEKIEIPAEEPVSLVPTNEELMFKVVNAFIEKAGDKAELVFALSGNGYEDVIPGTYDDAIAMQVGASHDTWIHGEKALVNCDYWTDRPIDNPPLQHHEEGEASKWQFRVPVNDLPDSGTFKVPVVAVSKSRYQKAEKADAENPDYSGAFTSRQFVINLDEKTVRTGNLKETIDVAVSSTIESFAAEEQGQLYTVGTPKSNEYTCQATITLKDNVYDKAFLGTADEAAAAEEAAVILPEDQKFVLPFFNTLGGKQHIVDGKAAAAFHVALTDEWLARTFTFDLEANKVTIEGEEISKESAEVIDTYDKIKAMQEVVNNPKATAQQMQTAVEAAKAAYDKLSVEQKAKLENGIANAEEALKEAQKAADKKAQEEKKDDSKPAPDNSGKKSGEAKISVNQKVKANGASYKVTKVASNSADGTVAFTAAANKKSVKVPDTVKLADGKTYKVTQVAARAFKGGKIKTVTIGVNVSKIAKKAFKGSKAAKLIVKSKKLKKNTVKGSLKGSKIKTVKVKVGSKKQNKKYVKKYKKIFTKKNAGKKVKVK